jgi:hypothetical protein
LYFFYYFQPLFSLRQNGKIQIIYMQQLAREMNANIQNTFRVFFFPVLLIAFCSFTNSVSGQTPPSFTGGAMQNFSVCMNTTASISTLLSVDDIDTGETETWSVLVAPAHGSLSGFTTSVISTGATITPAGVSYAPVTGYTGTDTFVVEVNDGTFTASTTIVVNVRPIPTLTSTTTPAGICDNATFFYIPVSSVSGSSFSWTRSFVPGIANAASSGGGTIAEALDNTTYYPLVVTYRYTVSAAGCSSVRNVVVNVAPAPSLQSPLADTACNGSVFSYTPVIGTTGATYSWSRAAVTGISPATSSGTGPISEMLTTALSVPVNVVYSFTITASGCTGTSNLNVTVAPAPPVTSITTASPATVCAGTVFQNFGAGIAPPVGITYNWTAVNATVNATGSTGQYSLVSFPNPGSASVTLHIGGVSALCVSNSTYNVTVGTGGSSAAPVIYYNFQFIYQDNTQDTYQWGYDNASTLDSTIIPGATFQSYPITTPDLINKYYWVITKKSGCMQKTYYNLPLAITNMNAGMPATMEVFPNPANNIVSIAVSNLNGPAEVVLTNMLGQAIKTQRFNGKNIQLDINDIPAGCYLVSCSQNGIKVVTERIIKN